MSVKLRAAEPDAKSGRLKDRPPNPDEVARGLPYLHRQIEIIRPRVIVTLGAGDSASHWRNRRRHKNPRAVAKLPRHPGDADVSSRVCHPQLHRRKPPQGVDGLAGGDEDGQRVEWEFVIGDSRFVITHAGLNI